MGLCRGLVDFALADVVDDAVAEVDGPLGLVDEEDQERSKKTNEQCEKLLRRRPLHSDVDHGIVPGKQKF